MKPAQLRRTPEANRLLPCVVSDPAFKFPVASGPSGDLNVSLCLPHKSPKAKVLCPPPKVHLSHQPGEVNRAHPRLLRGASFLLPWLPASCTLENASASLICPSHMGTAFTASALALLLLKASPFPGSSNLSTSTHILCLGYASLPFNYFFTLPCLSLLPSFI